MTSKSHKKLRQIAVDEENYVALRMMGHTPDSFNDIITRLLRQQQKKPLAMEVKL